MGAHTRARRESAARALLLGVVASAWTLALTPGPPGWSGNDRAVDALAPVESGLADWVGLTRAWVPMGDPGIRLDLLAAVLMLLTGAAAGWASFRLFRGPGRTLAAIVAAPLTTGTLAAWARSVPASPRLGAILLAAGLATVALATLLRARVRLGRLEPVPLARSLAASTAVAVLLPGAGVVLTFIVLATAGWSMRRDPGPRRPWVVAMLVGLSPATALAVALGLGGIDPGWSGLHVALRWPDALPLPLLTLGSSTVLVMLVALRWRGALVLGTWTTAALLLHTDAGPLVPEALVLPPLAIATSGWVWLAGSRPRRRPWVARGLAVTAAAALVLLIARPASLLRGRAPTAAATDRPTPSLTTAIERGVVAPGDGLLVHDPDLLARLERRRTREGWRPDIELLDANALDEDELTMMAWHWSARGRRILSDSFTAGGRWPSTWALDSGPLFWFVGEGEQPEDALTDITALRPEPLGQEADGWMRLEVERARFRRVRVSALSALDALSLPPARHRSLRMHLQLARGSSPQPAPGTELPPPPPDVPAEAAVLAEAGDLLMAHAATTRGAQMLAEASDRGHPRAETALVRWWLRAGRQSDAETLLDRMGTEPRPSHGAGELADWLLARGRHELAMRLLQDPTPGSPAAGIARRLAVQHQRAASPPEPAPEPGPPPSVSRVTD